MMEWAATTGRFVFHKDKSILTSTMTSKIKAVDNTSLKLVTICIIIYNI